MWYWRFCVCITTTATSTAASVLLKLFSIRITDKRYLVKMMWGWYKYVCVSLLVCICACVWFTLCVCKCSTGCCHVLLWRTGIVQLPSEFFLLTPLRRCLVKTSLDLAPNQPHTETVLLNPPRTVITRDTALTAIIYSAKSTNTTTIAYSVWHFSIISLSNISVGGNIVGEFILDIENILVG